MAVVTTDITPIGSYVGYQRRALEDQSTRNPLPNGEYQFSIDGSVNGAIPATGAGDNQRFTVECVLPGAQSYVMLGATLTLQGGTAGSTVHWQNTIRGWWQSGTTGTLGVAGFVRQDVDFEAGQASAFGVWSGAVDTQVESKIYELVRVPTVALSPPVAGGTPRLQLASYNATANDQAYMLYFFARFLAYDIERGFAAGLNTPQLIR